MRSLNVTRRLVRQWQRIGGGGSPRYVSLSNVSNGRLLARSAGGRAAEVARPQRPNSKTTTKKYDTFLLVRFASSSHQSMAESETESSSSLSEEKPKRLSDVSSFVVNRRKTKQCTHYSLLMLVLPSSVLGLDPGRAQGQARVPGICRSGHSRNIDRARGHLLRRRRRFERHDGRQG